MSKHDQAIYIRVTQEDLDRLDTLTERITVATRSGLARTALRLGLEAIERDPAVLLGEPVVKRGRKRKAKPEAGKPQAKQPPKRRAPKRASSRLRQDDEEGPALLNERFRVRKGK